MRWVYFPLALVFVVIVFLDMTLRSPNPILHGTREIGLLPMLALVVFVMPTMRHRGVRLAFNLTPAVSAVGFLAIVGSVAAIELATGAANGRTLLLAILANVVLAAFVYRSARSASRRMP